MVQFIRFCGLVAILSSVVIQVAVHSNRPATPDPYVIYIAYLDHDDNLTLRMIGTDGQSVAQDLITPRREWERFNRFTITHDDRYLLFNVRDPSGTHPRRIDLAGRSDQRWGDIGIEESFYSLLPNNPDQALVAVATVAYQTFYLHQADINGHAAEPLADYKVSLFGNPPRWSGDWIIFQHITDAGLGVAALNTVTRTSVDLSGEIPIAYLEQVDGEWVYFVGYGAGQDGTIFKVRRDGADRRVIGQSASRFGNPLQVVDGVLLYEPPSDGTDPPSVWAATDDPYPLLATDDAVWFSHSIDAWVILETTPFDGLVQRFATPTTLWRVQPDGSGAVALPDSPCGGIIGQDWSSDGRVHYTACYRDHRYWLEARSLPDGDFIAQTYIDLPVQPEMHVSPDGRWVLLRVVNDLGGVDWYRATPDGETLLQLTDDASQKDFATWYELPRQSPSGVPAAIGVCGVLAIGVTWRRRVW